MYNNSYGYGVYKRSQINVGNPYQMKKPANHHPLDEKEFKISDKSGDSDRELLISRDIVYKAKEDAAVIMREAELEAERIISQAMEKAKELTETMKQTAKEEGYRHGEDLAQQHYKKLVTEAKNYKDQCKNEYEDTLNSLEHEIVNLIVNIAEKILGDELHNNENAILGIVRETFNACSSHDSVLLKVSAEDYDYVVQNEETLRSMVSDLNDLEIRKDGALERGSCLIETDFGSVDGSCDTIIENIRQAFFSILHNASDES